MKMGTTGAIVHKKSRESDFTGFYITSKESWKSPLFY